MTLKAPARKSARKRTQRDYANLNSGLGSDPNRWQRMIESKDIKKDPFRRMQGSELESWLEDENALREPIIIEQPEGLGMKMPPRDLTVEHVAEYIGEDTPLEVIGKSHPFIFKIFFTYLPLCRCRISIDVSGVEFGEMGRLY
jgi:F-box/leucine-rich repeat protein 10/11